MKTAVAILVALFAGLLCERTAGAAPLEERTQPQRSAAPAGPVAEHARLWGKAARPPAALREVINTPPRAGSARPPARLHRPAAEVAAPGRYGTQLPTNRPTALKQRPPDLATLGGAARITRSPARAAEFPYVLRR